MCVIDGVSVIDGVRVIEGVRVAVDVDDGPIGVGVRVGVAVAIRLTFCAARYPIVPLFAPPEVWRTRMNV